MTHPPHTLRLLAMFAFAHAFAPSVSNAWEPVVCEWDPSRAIYFGGNGAPWPLATRDNVTPEVLDAIESASKLWNGVEGAYDLIEIGARDQTSCALPDNAGYSLIGLDDGTCAEELRVDWWGGNANGVRQYWVDRCQVINESIYFKPHDPASQAELGDVVLHELGHHLNYAHNWFDVSVMGYGVHMYWYLTSQDQGYMRWRYADGERLGARVHLHRTVLLSALGEEMRPGRHSQTLAPEPTCSGGDCGALMAGERVSLMMTYGNTGDESTGDAVRISMTLRDQNGRSTEIGAWMAGPLPAHSYNTYVFEAPVPQGVAPSSYDLRLEIDTDAVTRAEQGPSSTRYREFTGLRIVGSTCDKCDAADAGPLEETLLPVVHEGSLAWEGELDGSGQPRAEGCRVRDGHHTGLWFAWLSGITLAGRRPKRVAP